MKIQALIITIFTLSNLSYAQEWQPIFPKPSVRNASGPWAEDLRQYEVEFIDEQIIDAKGNHFKNYRVRFVLTANEKLYLIKDPSIYVSNLTAGHPIYFAGIMRFEDGELKYINPTDNEYPVTDSSSIIKFLYYLKDKKVNIENISYNTKVKTQDGYKNLEIHPDNPLHMKNYHTIDTYNCLRIGNN